jgi:uncharacterized protein YxjI
MLEMDICATKWVDFLRFMDEGNRAGIRPPMFLKKRFRLRDSYSLSIDPGQDDVLILAVAECIDEMAHGGR